MGSRTPPVTVVVPTLANAQRRKALMRAIESIRRSSTQPIAIVVVVNGARFESWLLRWLEAQPDVTLLQASEPSLPLAIARGRRAVETEYFSFLDDDDEYLPEATDIKLDWIQRSRSDVVITNGYTRSHEAKCTLRYTRLNKVATDPLRALFEENWLHNCNALYSTAAVDSSFFSDGHKYLEWTWLAFRLVMEKKQIYAVDEPTFVYNSDTPGSLSKSSEVYEATELLYRRMLTYELPARVRSTIHCRRSSNQHAEAEHWCTKEDITNAWRCHLRSLGHWHGLRYLLYTRRLLARSIQPNASRS